MHQSQVHILPRRAITDTLAAAVATHKLVVLTAPMGYGKTTAARELARHLSHRVFFLTAIAGGHSGLYIWDRACDELAAQGSQIAKGLREMGFPSDPLRLARAMDRGRDYLAGRPTLLIIDDYHHIEDPQVDALIETMTRTDIPGLRLLLLTRAKPRLPLEDLSLKGLCLQFDQSLLTFSQEEVAAFFALHGVGGRDLAARAFSYSEGWAAALWLGLQSYRAHGALAPERDVDSLLESVVFSRYEEADRRLLLQLSPLAHFSPRQAAQVSGDPGAPRRLIDLHDRNALLNYDPPTDSYRLHSLFRSFLQQRLEEGLAFPDIDLPGLYRRIGDWFAAEGDALLAIRAYAQAGTDEDYLRILKIFEIPGDGLLVMFDPEGLRAIFAAIPWPVRLRRPVGYLAFIYHLMSRVSIQGALPLMQEAERRFADETSLPEPLRRRLAGEITLMRMITAFNDLFAMRDIHEAAHKLLGGRSSIAHRRLIWTFGSPHAAFLYLREPGTYSRLIDLIDRNLHYYQDMADGCSAGAQDLFKAERLLEIGRPARVEGHLVKAIYRAGAKEQVATVIAANFTLARLFLARGEPARALALFDDLRRQYALGMNLLLATSLDVGWAYLLSCLGNIRDMPEWLRKGESAGGRTFYQGAIVARIVHCRVLLLKKDWLRCETAAQDMPASMGPYTHLFGHIHAKVLEACAVYRLDGLQPALEPLRRAVTLARPDGIMLTIAEYGRHVYPLLRALAAEQPGDAFVGHLLRVARRYARLTPDQPEGGDDFGLKERERLYLSLAAEGKGNQQIAEHLGLSLPAVKKNFSAIYRKLGVSSRVEALRKWAEREA